MLNGELIEAIRENDLDAMQDIIEDGADPTFNLWESVKVAVEVGYLDGVILLSKQKRVNLSLLNCSLLRVAIDAGSNNVLRYLLKSGVNPNTYNSFPSLAIAVKSDNVEAISLLLDHGAHVEAENHCALRNVQSVEAFSLIGRRYESVEQIDHVLKQWPLDDDSILNDESLRKIAMVRKMDLAFGQNKPKIRVTEIEDSNEIDTDRDDSSSEGSRSFKTAWKEAS